MLSNLVRDLNGSHGYANNKMSKNSTLDITSNHHIGMAFRTHLLSRGCRRAFHNAYIGERIGVTLQTLAITSGEDILKTCRQILARKISEKKTKSYNSRASVVPKF